MAYCKTSTSCRCYKSLSEYWEASENCNIILLLLLLCIFFFLFFKNLVCFCPGVIATGGDVHVRVWAVHFFFFFVTDLCIYIQFGLTLWLLYEFMNWMSAKYAWAWQNPGPARSCRHSDSSERCLSDSLLL